MVPGDSHSSGQFEMRYFDNAQLVLLGNRLGAGESFEDPRAGSSPSKDAAALPQRATRPDLPRNLSFGKRPRKSAKANAPAAPATEK